MEKQINKKEHYLTKFKRNNDIDKFGFSKEVEESGEATLLKFDKARIIINFDF